MKYFLLKIKEVLLSILPIVLIVLFMHFLFADFSSKLLLKFLLSVIIIIVGEVLFLTGVDTSVMQMGNLVGGAVNKFSKYTVILFFSFIFGLFATIAEPDLNVLSSQVIETQIINVNKFLFVFIVGAGVGAFVAFALFRIIKSINYKLVIYAIYICIIIFAIFANDSILAIAFDAGGATTGIVTSPFLLALSNGVAQNKKKNLNSDNFGVIGIASTGPILAVLFLSLISTGKNSQVVIENVQEMNLFLDVLIDAIIAIIPLVAVFFIFNALFLKIPKKKKINIIIGSIITFVGLYLFLLGIDLGMLEMGKVVGEFLSTKSNIFTVFVCLAIGFLITFTEPAVRVLGSQVEDVTQGNVRSKLVIYAIAFALMLGVSISALKILYDFSIWYIIGIGYGLILLLIPFSSMTFVSIAFDSGGVASGPMSAAFILPLMLGLAGSNGGVIEGFGLIAAVGMTPILILEILGVIYKIGQKINSEKEHKRALRISYGIDMLSNIEALEEAYNRRQNIKKLEEENRLKLEEEIMLAQQLEQIKEMREEDNDEIQG